MNIPALAFCVTLMLAASACNVKTTTTSNAANISVNTEAPPAPEETPASGAAESAEVAAAAVVADLYKQHDAKKSPFFQTKNRALVDKFFTKPLADLIWKDANNSSGEVGAIDGDPLYNAQDTEIRNFAVGKAAVKGEAATVPVTFTNYGQKVTVNFALKRVGAAWKIDNILYGSGDSLLKWLKDTYATQTEKSVAGEFDGKFIVGPTFCVVKPVKMAFEVKWAKGTGAEMFYYKDGNTFESNNDEGTNQFVFDDENYNTGTFYRADGKTFPIKRAK
jgi:hypothetical protein